MFNGMVFASLATDGAPDSNNKHTSSSSSSETDVISESSLSPPTSVAHRQHSDSKSFTIDSILGRSDEPQPADHDERLAVPSFKSIAASLPDLGHFSPPATTDIRTYMDRLPSTRLIAHQQSGPPQPPAWPYHFLPYISRPLFANAAYRGSSY